MIAREQVGTFLVTNDILVERIDNTNNLAELLEQKASMDNALIDEIANTIAKFAFHKVVHTDLNIRNLLINDKGQCFVIDFDKCFIKDGFTKDDLINMLIVLSALLIKKKSFVIMMILTRKFCVNALKIKSYYLNVWVRLNKSALVRGIIVIICKK